MKTITLGMLLLGSMMLTPMSVSAQKSHKFDFQAMAANYGDYNVHNFTSSVAAYNFRISGSIKPSVQTPDFGIYQAGNTFEFQNCTTDFGLRHYGAGKTYNDGLYTSNDRYIIMQNLEAGDKMVVDYNKENVSSAMVYFPIADLATYDNAGTPTNNTEWGEVVDGTEYTALGTWLAIQQKNKSAGTYIYSITLTKQHDIITIGADGYTTFTSFYGLDFSTVTDKVKAYTAVVEDGKVVMTQVTGFVPANTGLFIKAIGGTTSVSVPTAETAAFSQDNDLVGAAGGKIVTADDATAYTYVFGKSAADGLCFFKVTDGQQVSVPVGKAYLSAAVAPARMSIVFNDEVTGIKSIDNGQLTIDNTAYDLQGRRVAQPAKGLYIINGKKVIVK